MCRAITRDYLGLRLRQAGVAAEQITFEGAATTHVSRVTVRVTPEMVAEVVRALAAAAMPDRDLEVEIFSPRQALLVPGEEVEVRFEDDAAAYLVPGYNLLHARVLVDGVFWRALPVHLRLRTFSLGLTTTRDILPGERFSPTDVAPARIETTDGANDCLTDFSALEGSRARRFLRRGERVRATDAEPVPAVSKGQSVVIQVSAGAVVLSCPGVAAREADVGQQVEVVSAYDGRRLTGTVLAPGVVQILAGSPKGVETGAQ